MHLEVQVPLAAQALLDCKEIMERMAPRDLQDPEDLSVQLDSQDKLDLLDSKVSRAPLGKMEQTVLLDQL